MKARVSNSVLNNSSYRFGADEMNAISIPADKIQLLRGSPLNYTPFFFLYFKTSLYRSVDLSFFFGKHTIYVLFLMQ